MGENPKQHDCVVHLALLMSDAVNKTSFFQQIARLQETKIEQNTFNRAIKLLEAEIVALKKEVSSQSQAMDAFQKEVVNEVRQKVVDAQKEEKKNQDAQPK